MPTNNINKTKSIKSDKSVGDKGVVNRTCRQQLQAQSDETARRSLEELLLFVLNSTYFVLCSASLLLGSASLVLGSASLVLGSASLVLGSASLVLVSAFFVLSSASEHTRKTVTVRMQLSELCQY